MKYRVFASPSLVWRAVSLWSVIVSLSIGTIALSKTWHALPFFCIAYVLFGLFIYVSLCNAFAITTMDENGIHNRYANWKWEELTEYTIEPIYLYKWRIIPDLDRPLDSLICFGAPFEGSFLRVSRRNRAFISITAKNLKRMHLLAKGRSLAVNELWHRYSETLNCEKIDI